MRAPFIAGMVMIVCAVTALTSSAQSLYERYRFRTLAGNGGGTNIDGQGSTARFLVPGGLATDQRGNIYVADSGNQTIRKITPAGVVSTLAGSVQTFGSTDGTGSAARFHSPLGIAVAPNGDIYVADTGNHTIRKLTPSGVVTTHAGRAGVVGSNDGAREAALFNQPFGLALDSTGALYVADTSNHTIRRITAGGEVTTLAGAAGQTGSANGAGEQARFHTPRAVEIDSAGNVFVADSENHLLRKITAGGIVSTVAGSSGRAGSADGEGSAAQFSAPQGLALDGSGTIYVADRGNRIIRRVTPAGMVSTIAGSADSAGTEDGAAASARFRSPSGIAVDPGGELYISDASSNTIRKLSGGTVSTFAGQPGGSAGSADGPAASARFHYPSGIALDEAGNVYVADSANDSVRKISADRLVSTLAGKPGSDGSVDGPAAEARFFFPQGLARDAEGNLYIGDVNNYTVRKMTPAGVVSTLAGKVGAPGSADGAGTEARFKYVLGLAADRVGNVYVADSLNNSIRKITPAGNVSTLAGCSSCFRGSADGTGATARFNGPSAVAVDSAGNLVVTDSHNHTIRKVTPDGVVTTIAGRAGMLGSRDGPAASAQFYYPSGVALDSDGNIYVADSSNNTIRKISASGFVTTLAGAVREFSSEDGVGSAARFDDPSAMAVDSAGQIYVTDTFNNTIRIGGPTAVSQLLNISTRVRVEPGDHALIGGLIITGSVPKKVVLRAIGPSLANSGVAAVLRDPRLELRDGAGTLLASNDHWQDAPNAAEIADSGVAPTSEAESAILTELQPAQAYTAIVRGSGDDDTGVALVEAYDLNGPADALLANISTRGFVSANDNVMIGGFILGGAPGSSAVLVRGLGPSLQQAGIDNPLSDPTLALHDSNGSVVASNDDWEDDDRAGIESTGIPPESGREAAIRGTFPPGAFTAVIRGSDGATGVALVEVYQLQ